MEEKIYETLSLINSVMVVNDWNFNIYYDFEYNDCLLLAKPDKNGIYGDIDAIYNIKNNTFSSCKIKRTDEMKELGNINQIYKLRKIKSENHDDIDIKI